MATLLDPRNTDVADLLAVIRDISERLGQLERIDRYLGCVGDIGEDLDGITRKLDAIERHPGYLGDQIEDLSEREAAAAQ